MNWYRLFRGQGAYAPADRAFPRASQLRLEQLEDRSVPAGTAALIPTALAGSLTSSPSFIDQVQIASADSNGNGVAGPVANGVAATLLPGLQMLQGVSALGTTSLNLSVSAPSSSTTPTNPLVAANTTGSGTISILNPAFNYGISTGVGTGTGVNTGLGGTTPTPTQSSLANTGPNATVTYTSLLNPGVG